MSGTKNSNRAHVPYFVVEFLSRLTAVKISFAKHHLYGTKKRILTNAKNLPFLIHLAQNFFLVTLLIKSSTSEYEERSQFSMFVF